MLKLRITLQEMSKEGDDLDKVKYTKTHEWIEFEITDRESLFDREMAGTVGITDRGQSEHGEVDYVELPEVGDEYEQEEPVCTLELSNKDTFIVRSPVTGEVQEINEALKDDPDLINRSPEGDGWIFKIRIEIPRELSILMDRANYDVYEEDSDERYYYDDGDDDDLFFDDEF